MQSRSAIRVLLIEDNVGLRRTLEIALADDFDVLGTQNAEEALAFLSDQRFDVLVSDIDLPGISGIELVQRLRDAGHMLGVRAVLITGHGPGTPFAMDPMPEVLIKPFELELLIRSIRECLTT